MLDWKIILCGFYTFVENFIIGDQIYKNPICSAFFKFQVIACFLSPAPKFQLWKPRIFEVKALKVVIAEKQ